MPKTTAPLTATQVKQARPRDKEYNLADGNGLYLRVKQSGRKLWLFNYQKPYSKQRSNISIGIYPYVSLADAKVERDRFKSLLAMHVDPREFRAAEKQKEIEAHSNSFENVFDKWLKFKEPDVSRNYYLKIKNRINKYILPKLGKRPIHKITAVEVIEIITPLADEKKLETVKKICRWLNEIMTYAVNSGILYSNPLSGIGKAFNAPKSENLPTLKPDEFPNLLSAISKANLKPVTRLLLYWQLHTMVRPSEASSARWAEINHDKRLWEIPAERMKKKRSHSIPLTKQTLELLNAIEPYSGHREFIFPSHNNPRKPANSQTVNMALKRMGFKGLLVSHGFRSLASTILNEQGFDPDIIEAALAHADQNTIRATYNRAEYIERRRVMMQWWSDLIEDPNNGSSTAYIKQLRVVAGK